MKAEKKTHRMVSLRVTDPETARVVAVHRPTGQIVGAGCLIDRAHVLTCRHVVAAALVPKVPEQSAEVLVTLVGATKQPTVRTKLREQGSDGPENDLALLEIDDDLELNVSPVEFASLLRHGGKNYSVLGFPGGDQQGRNAAGKLHAADAKGLVQMDRGGALSVLGGFSGAPVWCSDVNAFVGLVVTELSAADVSWCIPSRLLCQFFPELPVRFRMPPPDRPQIHDYEIDDPNVQIFGTVSDNGKRRLTAKITLESTESGRSYFQATVTYKVKKKAESARGQFVTFITYPDFEQEGVDAYELFAPVIDDEAEVEFYPGSGFTLAAIGDGGDTALTVDLSTIKNKPKEFA